MFQLPSGVSVLCDLQHVDMCTAAEAQMVEILAGEVLKKLQASPFDSYIKKKKT